MQEKESPTRLRILSILDAAQQEMFGRDIIKASEQSPGLRLQLGVIYVDLNRMEEDRLVSSREMPLEPGLSLPRRKYSITSAGRFELHRK
ncbi:MAG: helix-turn-helix transcriptional regulator [Alphaproteobacteria bacterium]